MGRSHERKPGMRLGLNQSEETVKKINYDLHGLKKNMHSATIQSNTIRI